MPSEILSVDAAVERLLRPDTLLGAVAYLLLFCVLASLLSRGLRAGIQAAVAHADGEHLDRTAVNFLRQLGVLIIWIFVLALYAHLIPALRAVGTAMLAGASIASIVLGLAAQSTLGNLIAGISILIYRPFRLGDLLQVQVPTGSEIGTVEQLSLGYTILSTQDGRRIIVPNSVAISQVTVNLNAFASDAALTLAFWASRSQLLQARSLAIGFAQALPAHVIGCFVVKSEPLAVQLSLALRPTRDATAVPKQELPGRLASMLKQAGVESPAGKEAPALTSS